MESRKDLQGEGQIVRERQGTRRQSLTKSGAILNYPRLENEGFRPLPKGDIKIAPDRRRGDRRMEVG